MLSTAVREARIDSTMPLRLCALGGAVQGNTLSGPTSRTRARTARKDSCPPPRQRWCIWIEVAIYAPEVGIRMILASLRAKTVGRGSSVSTTPPLRTARLRTRTASRIRIRLC